jgi:osmotically-inducible protein OsmY
MRTDLEIQQDVINEMKWQPHLKSSNIGVSVKNGVVTLSGIVDSFAQKVNAEKAAKKVFGVRAVAEDIQIGDSPSYHKTDAEIAESVVSALRWNSGVPDEKIKVKVENGVVTLEGEVEWDFQRSVAKNAVAGLIGVKNVYDLTNVKPKITASDLKAKIKAALQRAATVDAGNISVNVEGSAVTLRGIVRSYSEKEEAGDAAWAAPGITSVSNFLEVEPELEFA